VAADASSRIDRVGPRGWPHHADRIGTVDLPDGRVLVQSAGVTVAGNRYFIALYELDSARSLATSTGGDGYIRDEVGWFGSHAAVGSRQRIVVVGSDRAAGSPVRIRQYWR
jgi:hypothetical protein